MNETVTKQTILCLFKDCAGYSSKEIKPGGNIRLSKKKIHLIMCNSLQELMNNLALPEANYGKIETFRPHNGISERKKVFH